MLKNGEDKSVITRLTLSVTRPHKKINSQKFEEWTGEEAKEEYIKWHELTKKETHDLNVWCATLGDEELKNVFLYSFLKNGFRFPASREAYFSYGTVTAVTPFKFTESELYARTHGQTDLDYGTHMFQKYYSAIDFASFTFYPYRASDWSLTRKNKAYTKWKKEDILEYIGNENLELDEDQTRAAYLTHRLVGGWNISTAPTVDLHITSFCILPTVLRKITLRDTISTPYEILKRRVLNQALYYGSEYVKFNTEPEGGTTNICRPMHLKKVI